MKNPKTKYEVIYKILSKNRGKWVSVFDIMRISNCVCVGSVCANLRKMGCNIDNKEEFSSALRKS